LRSGLDFLMDPEDLDDYVTGKDCRKWHGRSVGAEYKNRTTPDS
jgi:hypothetical protein